MKILIVPMVAMAETSGPSSRCRLLAEGFRSEGFDVATCMAKDVNYKVMNGIRTIGKERTKSNEKSICKDSQRSRWVVHTEKHTKMNFLDCYIMSGQ